MILQKNIFNSFKASGSIYSPLYQRLLKTFKESKKDGKDQERIQPSTTPYQRYRMGK